MLDRNYMIAEIIDALSTTNYRLIRCVYVLLGLDKK